MSSAQSGEGDIRRALVEADVVDCMIALPGQLFYSTQIPACLWFLARNKNPGGWRDRRGEVLFIDARKLGHLVDRTRKEFSNEPRADILGKRGLRLSSRLSSFRKRKSVPSPISWLGPGCRGCSPRRGFAGFLGRAQRPRRCCAGWRGVAERWWWSARRVPPAKKEAIASAYGPRCSARMAASLRRRANPARAITTASRAG